MFEQLGLIGCGLMGGSFALALKRAGLVQRVVGYSPSTSTLQKALQLGVIDTTAASVEQAASGADLVLVAVPVSATEATLQRIAPAVTPEMLVMDVGSTKTDVLEAAQRALGQRIGSFVPAHPIAGKEKAGVAHADARLYQGCQVILTPTTDTLDKQRQQAQAIWQALGCTVLQMSPEAHDAAFAAVSHFPHLLAFALMNAVTGQPQGQEFLSLAGPGFRDFTRIAASDPIVWRDIFLSNRQQLLLQSQHLQTQLQAFEALMLQGDGAALEALIAQASSARSHWHLKQHHHLQPAC
ncbi:MAG: prephenate dehydrogenase/arogenate dehydrogenase family protein [Rhodoferax sp.]|jgi:prephenate dehydrogenase|uniref:prephenate dehydrogenase n=1 Tax=Rhodoferax sp. TaxID=50421 RepID=UPI003BB5966A